MDRLWRIGGVGCLFLAAILAMEGCSGRTIEGQWKGPVPGVGLEGHIRFSPGNKVAGASLSGPKSRSVGRYALEKDTLEIQWTETEADGKMVPATDGPFKAKIDEWTGNRIVLSPRDGGATITWERTAN